MKQSIWRLSWVLSILVVAAASAQAADSAYGYPIHDRWTATVVGTPEPFRADLPKESPLREKRIVIFKDRKIPEVIWYEQEMRYSAALQKGAAPVMFLIAGTGASHGGSKNVYMAKAFYERGFHVISLSSPTYPNFVASASKTGVPGHVNRDAEDLYRAMQMTWNDIKGSRTATGFYLTGYSLGAFNAAFVAYLDEQKKVFDFERVLMINPPVSLYNSISLLDRMSENIPGGADNFGEFFERIVRVFTDVYKRQRDAVGFGDDFLEKVFAAMQPKDEELAALIGVAFRVSSASMVFTSDVMTDFGYVKPKGKVIGKYEDLKRYRQTVNRLGFTDFYHEFFYPYYSEEYPDLDRDGFIDTMGLHSISDYLRSADNIRVLHNQDDVILAPGEIDYIKDVFGERVKVYPYGGHLGNMMYRENTADMVGAITR